MKILFICRGNVGRSQMAEALFKKMADDSFEVISAGIKLSGPEQPIGELSPAIDEVLAVMSEEGIDVSGNIRRQVTEEMANSASKIVLVVDECDPVPDYLVDNQKVVKWDVLDPKGQSLEFTRNVKDQIKDLVKDFVINLRTSS
jgi:arsenate reductase (thioredoxin)